MDGKNKHEPRQIEWVLSGPATAMDPARIGSRRTRMASAAVAMLLAHAGREKIAAGE